MEVKICGLRRMADVDYVNEYLPEYGGFIMAESKRKISPETFKTLKERLDMRIKPVCIFVNQSIDYILEVVSLGAEVVQLHGDESDEFAQDLRIRLDDMGYKGVHIWRALRVSGKDSSIPCEIKNRLYDRILIDSWSDRAYGGTGEMADLDATLKIVENSLVPVVLAGGLTPENVESIIKRVNPICVDVSSGVETDGFKDKEKIEKFVKRVRNSEVI